MFDKGVITWIDRAEMHLEGLMGFHLISLLWISVQGPNDVQAAVSEIMYF